MQTQRFQEKLVINYFFLYGRSHNILIFSILLLNYCWTHCRTDMIPQKQNKAQNISRGSKTTSTSFKGYSVNCLSHVPHIREIISLNTYTVNRLCHFWRLRPHVTASVHRHQLSTVNAKERVFARQQLPGAALRLRAAAGGRVQFVPLALVVNRSNKLRRTRLESQNLAGLVGYPGLKHHRRTPVQKVSGGFGALYIEHAADVHGTV